MECGHKFTICRLCLCERESFVDIFQENELFVYVPADAISDLLQLQVSETDGYPHVVCSICLGKLTDFKQFKEQCQNSRHAYNNMLASYESDDEHPADIEPSASIKSEQEDGTDEVDITTEVELWPVKLEPKDPLDTQEAQKEVRKCSVAFTSLEHSGRHRKRIRRESNGPYAGVEVGEMGIKVKRDCISPDERIDMFPVEESDLNGEELSVVGLRRGTIKRREEGKSIDANVDATVGDKGTVELKIESENETGERNERGEEAPLGVEEREGEHFSCHDCGKGFQEKDVLIRHLELHGYVINEESCVEERDSQVDANVTSGSDSLKTGLEGETSYKIERFAGIATYVCGICRKGFSRRDHVATHLRVHNGDKPFPCGVCGKRFGSKSNLGRHNVIHTGKKPFTCEVCGMRFARKCKLREHGRIHSGEKPYVCEICGKRFSQSCALTYHKRVHTGEKPYECDTCGKRFSHGCTLTSHKRVHTGEKPYECDTCGKKYSHSGSLTYHRRTHSGENP